MRKILLLEDDISLVDGLKYSLKKNGFDVEVARTVCEAIKYLAEISKYDLLILDVTLPDGTGFEVCEKVRKQNQQIPIIFLTASDEEVNIIRGLDSGGDDYVTKPFKLGNCVPVFEHYCVGLVFLTWRKAFPSNVEILRLTFWETACP